MGLIDLIWDQNKQFLKRMTKIAHKVDDLAGEMELKTDEELRNYTEAFKQRYQDGESLDSIQIEAFAVVREASKRVLGMFPFFVQILGGIALHEGNIAEMRTGEGKTLTSTMPVYLNAITGKGVHVVTVNEYLVQRDAEEMGVLYNFLGLSVGVNLNEMSATEKREAYQADITYSTNNELGFDYLRDNMVLFANQKVQRELHFAVVDEVDSILIDESRTPLIISGTAQESTQMYMQASMFVRSLKAETDYSYDEESKSVQLSEAGMTKAETSFGIDNLFDTKYSELYHHINQALHAHVTMKRDVDYVVQEGEIIIVDSFTGRLMHGRRYSDGLHQAIEAKEGLHVQNETMTLATITFQNYFRMYAKLSGMTGTAKTEEEEFRNIYNMYVVVVPTNKPVIRIDKPDLIYPSLQKKFQAVAADVAERHKLGQPVLLGTVAIETSEYVSALLKRLGVPHNVLNAKQHEREAEIITSAGELGAVTIATNMAGRGTDIKLGEGVREVGGLAVIGTERHESRRIDNQLRGRSGRQGDPGYTQFYLSTEDDLLVRFAGEMARTMINKQCELNDGFVQEKTLSKAVESAQKRVEGNNFDSRKQLLQYDDVIRQQRETIYKQRNEILNMDDVHAIITSMITESVTRNINSFVDPDGEGTLEKAKVMNYLQFNIMSNEEINDLLAVNKSSAELIAAILEYVNVKWNKRAETISAAHLYEFEKVIVLKTVDKHWMGHIDSMDQLRSGIHLRAYAQTDPLHAYQAEGFAMFEAMIQAIEDDVTRSYMKAEIVNNLERKEVVKANPIPAKDDGETKRRVKKKKEIKQKQPCPCGSGKKFKHCHGKTSG